MDILADTADAAHVGLVGGFLEDRVAVVADEARDDRAGGGEGLDAGSVGFPEVVAGLDVLVAVEGAVVPAAAARVEARAGVVAFVAALPVFGVPILELRHAAGIHFKGMEIIGAADGPACGTDTLDVLGAVVGGVEGRGHGGGAFRNAHGRVPGVEVTELVDIGGHVVVGMVLADGFLEVLGEPALGADTLDRVVISADGDDAVTRCVFHRHVLGAGEHCAVAIVEELPGDGVNALAHRVEGGEVVHGMGVTGGDQRMARVAEQALRHEGVGLAFGQGDGDVSRAGEAGGDRSDFEEAVDRCNRVVARHVFTRVGHLVRGDRVRVLANTSLAAVRRGRNHIGGGETFCSEARIRQGRTVIHLLVGVGGDCQRTASDHQFHVKLRRVVALGAADIESALDSSQSHHVVERAGGTNVFAHIVGLGFHRTGGNVLAVCQTGDGPVAGGAIAQVGGHGHDELRTVIDLAVREFDEKVARFDFHRTGGEGLFTDIGVLHIHATVRNRVGEGVVVSRVVGIGHIGHTCECRGNRQFVASRQREHQTVGAGIGRDCDTVVGHLIEFEVIAVVRAVVGDRRGRGDIVGRCQAVGAGGGDGDGSVATGDTELSQSSVDGVVGRDEDTCHRCVFDGIVLAGVDGGHRTRGVDVGHLTAHEAVAGNRVVRVGQRRAVIELGVGCGGDVDDARGDFQCAVLRRHIELCRHNIAVGILHHRRAGDGVRQVADILAARVTR